MAITLRLTEQGDVKALTAARLARRPPHKKNFSLAEDEEGLRLAFAGSDQKEVTLATAHLRVRRGGLTTSPETLIKTWKARGWVTELANPEALL